MSIPAIRAAVETAIKAVAPSFPTAWQNMPFTAPADGSAYQKVDLFFADPNDDEIGGTYTIEGFAQVTLCYPLGAGAGAAEARAETLKAAFPNGRALAAGLTVHHTPTIGRGFDDGARWVAPVTIRFFAQQ